LLINGHHTFVPEEEGFDLSSGVRILAGQARE
jgi:hypothetical protein